MAEKPAMTIEERFEFLFASIESHNQTLGEVAELQAKNEREIAELRASIRDGFGRIERIEKAVEQTERNIDRLALAMTGLVEHVAAHEKRLDKLEA